jgi:putative hydrolase of the HAD superfamily
MKMKIKAIIFDYGGVITLPQDIRLVKKICRLLGVSIDELKEVYQKDRQDYDSGLITAEQYWAKVGARLDKNNLPEDAVEKLKYLDIKSWRVINNKTIKLIKKIKKAGFKLAVLSNMTYDTLPYVMKSGWIKYFDRTVFSCEEKICKPDFKIYGTVLERLSEKAEEVLFIDDSAGNIEAAVKLGINAIHYRNNGQLLKELKDRFGVNLN